MIRIDRGPAPIEVLERGAALTDEIREVIGDEGKLGDALGRVMRFWSEWKPLLEERFFRKCAYCETRYDATGFANIELFRPKSGVREDDGDFPMHYAWLAYHWENVLVSCMLCNTKFKGRRFPVAGSRAYRCR